MQNPPPVHSVSDPDLEFVIDRWPELPKAIRSAILTLVRAAVGDKER